MMIKPEVLIISSSLDFATDLICLKLNKNSNTYLRLNRDQLGEFKISLNPLLPSLVVKIDDIDYLLDPKTLKSVYYRAPTFLREIFGDIVSEEDQLFKTQWAAFVRSLLLFDGAKWINSPASTYKAEMKPYQLLMAKRVSFNVPETRVTNSISKNDLFSPTIAIKSLDTAIINKGEDEAFVYTSLIDSNEIELGNYSSPFFLQEGLLPKKDIRVTVIGNEVIAVMIEAINGIDIDWRKYKGELIYNLIDLPPQVQLLCVELTKKLNLVFSAIDLVLHNDDFYFIELNPTGEWAWLQRNTGYPFDDLIAKALLNDNKLD